MLTNPAQIRALSYAIGFQRPWLAERALTKNNALEIGEILSRWMLQSELDLDVQDMYRKAFLQGKTAHCALEFHRWALRSIPRLDGKKFASAISKKISVPVLQLHGSHDTSILLEVAKQSHEWIDSDYQFHELKNTGHLIPEDNPTELVNKLSNWLAKLPKRISEK